MKKGWGSLLLCCGLAFASPAIAQTQDYCEAESSVKLEYSPEALDARLMGDVVLKLQLGNDGEVHDVTVVRGHSKALADAAVTIAKSSIISCTEGWAGEVFEDVFTFDLKQKRVGNVINRSSTIKRRIRPWSLRPSQPRVSSYCSPKEPSGIPTYPRDAMLKGIEGTVVVEGQVAPNGRAINLVVSESSGDTSLDTAVMRFAKTEKFSCPSSSRELVIRGDFLLPSAGAGRSGHMLSNSGTMHFRYGRSD